ncbi:hypothetical protein GH714_001338 [Hevea brasiliensis]|uniref:RNase H type-1 domain-containing protein n=1 Tax=Hevea brasiliensis TaxID=3981 RepID=A0A6A6KI38_HEVBR|nr:hypothetical protein GH714_001338 [Hevea brasiliensis]
MNTAFLVKLGWRLLNEEDSLWAWIMNDGPLGDFAIQPVPSCIKQLTVAQMWDGQNWKWDMIHCFLPDELGYCNSITAELPAVVHGLSLAWELGYRRVCVEIDYKASLELIRGKVISNVRYVNLLSQCKALLAREWQISWAHCFREGNMVADKLVNLAVEADCGKHILNDPSTCVLELLRNDVQGNAWPPLLILFFFRASPSSV